MKRKLNQDMITKIEVFKETIQALSYTLNFAVVNYPDELLVTGELDRKHLVFRMYDTEQKRYDDYLKQLDEGGFDVTCAKHL